MNQDLNNNPSSVGEVLSSMIQQLNSGNSSVVSQIRDVGQSTTSTLDRIGQTIGVASPSASSSSIGKELLNVFNPVSSSNGTNILTSLFLGPVFKTLFSLFGPGGAEQNTVPLTKFSFPGQTRTDLAASLGSDGQASGVRADAFGLTQAAPVSQAPIQISIQALDARSILDRSDDIAAALKQAMLSNHEINDNLNEI